MAEKLEPGKIFVGGLSWDTTKESLSNYFKKYGEVLDSVIIFDSISNLPRGFGFVTFKDHNSVQAVVANFPHYLDGKQIDTKDALTKDHHQASQVTKSSSIENKVFIGGLPHSCKPEELKEFFAKFGEVQKVEIKMDRITGKPRGFAFVDFDCRNSCVYACQTQFQFFKDKKIEVKPAENRTPGLHQEQLQDSAQSANSWSQVRQQSQATPSYQPYGPHTSLYQASQYPSIGAYPNTYSSNTYPHSNINYNHYGTYQQASYPQASQADSAAYPMGPSQQSSNPYYTSNYYTTH